MLDYDAGAAGLAEPLLDEDLSLAYPDGAWHGEMPVDIRYVASQELLVIAKRHGGIDAHQIATVRQLIADVVAGQVGPCKFLVFDFANATASDSRPGAGFEDLITDLSDLIFQAPVVSVAWVRKAIAGADLELALACSMMVAGPEARFGFAANLADCLRSYALLAHRIGFVRAERLLEDGRVLDTEAMRALMLLQEIVSNAEGQEAITTFVKSRMRRHNSACGIYRAQRIAMLGA